MTAGAILDRLSWPLLVFACLTVGLAPFTPPHVWEKLTLLAAGRLVRPLDWFDLLMHGAPWVLLGARLVSLGVRRGAP